MSQEEYQLRANYLRSLVGCGDFHDSIRVDFKRDLDLRDSAGSRRDATELKFTKKIIIFSQSAFALIDLNEDRLLIISRCGETSMRIESR